MANSPVLRKKIIVFSFVIYFQSWSRRRISFDWSGKRKCDHVSVVVFDDPKNMWTLFVGYRTRESDQSIRTNRASCRDIQAGEDFVQGIFLQPSNKKRTHRAERIEQGEIGICFVENGDASRRIGKLPRFTCGFPPRRSCAPASTASTCRPRRSLSPRRKSVEDIRAYLGVDSLAYLSINSMLSVLKPEERENFCTACFTGKYFTEPGN